MELRQYLQIARRWIWLFALGLILGAGAGYFYSTRQTPVYESSTKVMVSQPPDSSMSYYDAYNDQQLAQNYIQLLTTQPILSAVSKKLGYEVDVKQISTKLIGSTSMFQVSVEDSDPQKAADISNSLVDELILQNEQLQNTRYASEEESLQAQLTQVENQISSLQEQIANVSEQSLETQQDKVKAEINGLEAQILQLQKDINQLQPMQSGGTPVATLSPADRSLLQEKQLKLDQLQSTLDFYNSIYLNLVATGISGTSGNSSENQTSQLQSTLALYQQIYSNLLSSYETVRLARLQNTPSVVQVEVAAANQVPIAPQPVKIIVLGGSVGLMLAAGIAFLAEYLDETIKSPDEISAHFKLPVIGYIGEISKSNGDSTIYVANEPLSPITEGFRSLKTTIDFSDGNNPPKTILITSANPAEGKTTIAVNLATVYSQGGKDVVIIDADFRRPSIHRYFGLSNRKGLSDVIQGTADARSVIRTRKDINLSVISSGSLPPNPAELLASDKTTRFFEHLKQLKLVSIIDTPPFLVSDAIQLAAKVDGVIIVVKPGKTSIHSLMAAKEQLDRVGANILGVVFNRIPRNRGYYYGSYQHYSKYYSKGYHKYYSGSDGNGSKPAEEMEKKPVKSKGVGSS